MNPVEELIKNFQNLVTQVPDIVQPLIAFIAGAVPFVEGEGAAIIGVVGGINPIVAAIAAAAGNFVSVFLVVALSSRARTAAVSRRRAARAEVFASNAGFNSGGAQSDAARPTGEATELETQPAKPESKGRLRFKRWLVRFGVPGASLLGPLAIPTQFTSAILVASGTPRAWVLLWQAATIVLWTTVSTVSVWLAITFVVGA